MSRKANSTRLELDEDLAFQKHELLFRRVGTAALGLMLAGAMLGLFGSGALSEAEERSADSNVSARFERLTRHHATTQLQLLVRSGQKENTIRVTVNSGFADAIQMEEIRPQPVQVAASHAHHVYAFAGSQRDSITRIVMRYRPLTLGWTPVVVLAAGSEVRFRQWVYP